MNTPFEDQIRERAYYIWQAGGMAEGFAVEHWMCAEQAVRDEVAGPSVEPDVILTKATARKAAAAKPGKTTAKVAKAAKPAAKTAAKPRASKAAKIELNASV